MLDDIPDSLKQRGRFLILRVLIDNKMEYQTYVTRGFSDDVLICIGKSLLWDNCETNTHKDRITMEVLDDLSGATRRLEF